MANRFRKFMYPSLFLAIVLMSIFALIITNKTLPISKDISRVNVEIAKIKEENQQLLYQVSAATSHQQLIEKAKHYGMKPSSVETFTHVKLKRNDK